MGGGIREAALNNRIFSIYISLIHCYTLYMMKTNAETLSTLAGFFGAEKKGSSIKTDQILAAKALIDEFDKIPYASLTMSQKTDFHKAQDIFNRI